MPNDIRERLIQAKAQLRSKQKLDAMLEEERVQLGSLQESCSRMARILDKEKADVDNLEGFSLVGLFYSILGTKEERLETERQEYLAAKLKYEESAEAVDEAQREIEELVAQLAVLKDAESEYNQLLKEKEKFLTQNGDPTIAAILKLNDQVVDLEADRKELYEAIRAGTTALRSLESVRSDLNSAENWGTWDMLGGGAASTWIKHSRIDSARRQAQVAQRHLRHFQKELADADERLQVSLSDFGSFLTFADYFFDGLIVDWVVQSKIQNASSACGTAIRQVSSAIYKCRHRHAETEAKLDQLADERRRLIEEA
ncbi:hypothetical protein LOC68_03455 [Blastopirellula sp. JC732]|uniref:Uncharacterized protein n=1 Tax=Blastopirellula sediminis TaxID=2894196 RepID=A0A9X1MHX2_9BACT|nr:hypothetical protein [Blastopirellula sediminis]MCC9607764.1 hypothetical protein [Blastopirellula sediminis]MCC9627443.1 hypothetical protein [Blastopirellula sediminis]